MCLFYNQDGENVSQYERMKAKNELRKTHIKRGGSAGKNRFVPESERGAGLRNAIVIMPVIIVIIIIAALIAGLYQFRSLFNEDMKGVERSRVTPSDDTALENKLLLTVNPENPIPSDFRTDLVDSNGIQIGRTAEKDLGEMLEAAKKDGLSLTLSGGYISAEQQQEMFSQEVSRLMTSEGLTNSNAIEKAEKTIPAGDHSERQTGLLVTFSSGSGKDFSETKEYLWLIRNSLKYGFILRYPEGREKETGFAYDPTCFRYVGKGNAYKITTLNMTLDEYSEYLTARNDKE